MINDFLFPWIMRSLYSPTAYARLVASEYADCLIAKHKNYVIAVDFDGTLCDNEWPKIGDPKEKVIEAVKEAKRRGASLILYTCREGKLLCEAIVWCTKQKIFFDAVNSNLQHRIDDYGNDCRKISFDELWDDRAVGFVDLVDDLP